jgi:hypothetical protein
MAALEEQYGVELSMLSSGVTILYSDFMDKKKREVRMLPISEWLMSLPPGRSSVSRALYLPCEVVSSEQCS